MSVLGTHLHQCTSWRCCERLRLASVNMFLKTLWTHFPISWWVIYEHPCPHCAECSAVVIQKQHDPCAPPSLFIRTCTEWLFFCFLGWKSPQREMFCWCGRGETKNSRSTKRHQNQKFKNFSEQWKKVLVVVLHQMESTLKVTEV